LRDIIGNNEMDFVLTERESIAQSIKEIVVANLVRPATSGRAYQLMVMWRLLPINF